MTSETFVDFKAHIERDHWMYGIRFERKFPYFQSAEARCLEINYPSTPGQVGHAANIVALLCSSYLDRQYFSGASLWFADPGVFAGWQYTAGRVVVDRIRAGFGDLRPFEEVDVHHFRADEVELLTAFVILGIVLGWDMFFLPDTDRFVHISHDEFMCVVMKSHEAEVRVREALPTELMDASPRLIERFCRPLG